METRFISKKQVIKGIYLFLLSFKPFIPNWGGGGGGNNKEKQIAFEFTFDLVIVPGLKRYNQ